MVYSIKVLILLILLTCSENCFSQSKYLRIQYNGDEPKPYPIIFFQVPGFTDTTKYDKAYILRYEISEEGLERIRKSMVITGASDSLLISTYDFTFFLQRERLIFITPYLTKIRQLFAICVTEVQNKEKQAHAEKTLTGILHRLEYTIQR